MIIEGNMVYADKGCVLRSKEDINFAAEKIGLGYLYYKDGEKLGTPVLVTADMFYETTRSEYEAEQLAARKAKYPALVESMIRKEYSVSDELAIQRQRESKTTEFILYNNFCEYCKRLAKEELGL